MLKKKRVTAVLLSLMLVVGISGIGIGETTAYAEEMQEAVKTEAEEEAVNKDEELAEQEQVESPKDDAVSALNDSESVENEMLDKNEEDILQNEKDNVKETDLSEMVEKDEISVEKKRNVFRQTGNAEDICITDEGAEDLPIGVSYDASTNTLSINNSKIGTIDICCTTDLTIKVSGENTIGMIYMNGEWLDEEREEYACGDICITGTGMIYAKSFSYGCNFIWQNEKEIYNAEGQRDLGINGDIYIDGVTIITDCGLITSHYSNVTIRNATIQINNGNAQNYSKYGITTGRAFGNFSWEKDFKQEKYGGILTIENSEMEIKYCREILLAWNELNASGCNYYLGKESPEYQIDLEKICWYSDYDSFKRGVISDIDYLKITSKNLGLPKAYELIDGTASNAKGSISFPDRIEVGGKEVCEAGKKVNVTVKPDSGYQLDKLYVNGKAISGTSFTMPAKDTTVKAEFVKKKVKVTGVKITAPSKKIASGKKVALGVKVSPAEADNKKVTWSVNNKKYASVNSKGVVTMKKAGAGKTVTVTAKAADRSGQKASVKIKVMKGVVKKIKLTAAKSVKAGKKTAVKAKVTASKGANKTLAYSVSNKKYASVNSKGVVTAKKAGKGKKITVTAKATDGSNKKAVVKIKIK